MLTVVLWTAGAYEGNPWSASAICMQDLNLVITVSADGLAPDSARPSAGTVMTRQVDMLASYILAVSDYWYKNTVWRYH